MSKCLSEAIFSSGTTICSGGWVRIKAPMPRRSRGRSGSRGQKGSHKLNSFDHAGVNRNLETGPYQKLPIAEAPIANDIEVRPHSLLKDPLAINTLYSNKSLSWALPYASTPMEKTENPIR